MKRSKFKNVWTEVDGLKFQSKREAKRYQELKLLEKAGEITGLRRQVRYEIIPATVINRPAYYYADFVYIDSEGREIIEDCKGMRTDLYKLKKKLMYERHGIIIFET